MSPSRAARREARRREAGIRQAARAAEAERKERRAARRPEVSGSREVRFLRRLFSRR